MTTGSPLSRAVALLLLIVVLTASYVLVGWPLWNAYDEANAAIGDRRLALMRLEDAAHRQTTLIATLRKDTTGPLMISERSDSSAAAAMQTVLLDVLQEHTADLVSVEALPGEPIDTYRAIRLRVQFSTGHQGLARILHALEDGRPMVFVENLSVNARSARVVGVERPIDVRADLTAFRLADG